MTICVHCKGGKKIIPQTVTAILFAIPLMAVAVISARYFVEFKGNIKRGTAKQETPYNKLFLSLVGLGYFCIWPFWIGGMALLFLNKYHMIFKLATFAPSLVLFMQVVGFLVFLHWSSAVELDSLFCRQVPAPLNSRRKRGAQTDSNGAVGHREAFILHVLHLDPGRVEFNTTDLVAFGPHSVCRDWCVSDSKNRRRNIDRAVWRGIH